MSRHELRRGINRAVLPSDAVRIGERPVNSRPEASCPICGCRLSRYRHPGETICAPCQGPTPYQAIS